MATIKETNYLALEKHIAAIFDEVENMAPEKALVQLFRLKYDYHNVKTIIKAHGADTDGSALLSTAAASTSVSCRRRSAPASTP